MASSKAKIPARVDLSASDYEINTKHPQLMATGVLCMLLALPIFEFTKESANPLEKFSDGAKDLVLLVGVT